MLGRSTIVACTWMATVYVLALSKPHGGESPGDTSHRRKPAGLSSTTTTRSNRRQLALFVVVPRTCVPKDAYPYNRVGRPHQAGDLRYYRKTPPNEPQYLLVRTVWVRRTTHRRFPVVPWVSGKTHSICTPLFGGVAARLKPTVSYPPGKTRRGHPPSRARGSGRGGPVTTKGQILQFQVSARPT
jgi:hypothetical protein